MSIAIYAGGVTAAGVSVQTYGPDGEKFWSTAGYAVGSLHDLGTDGNSHVYVIGGHGTSSTKLQKYDPGGALVWSADTLNSTGSRLAVNSEGYSCVAQGANLRTYSPSGSLLWTAVVAAVPFLTTRLAMADDGHIFVAAGTNPPILRKYSLSGSVVWTSHLGLVGPSGVAIDPDGHLLVVTGNLFSASCPNGSHCRFLHKFDADGGWIYSRASPAPLGSGGYSSVASDSSGNILIGGSWFTPTAQVHKYAPDGTTLLWRYTHGAIVHSVHVTPADDILICGPIVDGVSVRLLDGADGTPLLNLDRAGAGTLSVSAGPLKSFGRGASLLLTGSGTGTRIGQGGGVAATVLTGTGTGTRIGQGSGTVPVVLTGSGRGTRLGQGSGSATVVLTGKPARGAHVLPGIGTGIVRLLLTGSSIGSPPHTLTFDHLQSVADEKQNTFQMIIAAGEHRLTFDGNESEPIHLGSPDTLATLVAKLEAIAGSGTVRVHGLPDEPLFPLPYVVEFIGGRANQPNPLFLIDDGDVLSIQVGSALFA